MLACGRVAVRVRNEVCVCVWQLTLVVVVVGSLLLFSLRLPELRCHRLHIVVAVVARTAVSLCVAAAGRRRLLLVSVFGDVGREIVAAVADALLLRDAGAVAALAAALRHEHHAARTAGAAHVPTTTTTIFADKQADTRIKRADREREVQRADVRRRAIEAPVVVVWSVDSSVPCACSHLRLCVCADRLLTSVKSVWHRQHESKSWRLLCGMAVAGGFITSQLLSTAGARCQLSSAALRIFCCEMEGKRSRTRMPSLLRRLSFQRAPLDTSVRAHSRADEPRQ